MTLSLTRHQPGLRAGVDACPGISERGHGLTMTIIHDPGCCHEWETGQAATPARAQAFGQAAARWGSTWPAPPRPPGPGTQAQAETEPEAGTS